MHEIHHTEGFILHTSDAGEANTLFHIFTKDLGRITATAQSLRREQSKLRGHLALYAHVALDVVQGRAVWRIIAARSLDDLPFSLPLPVRRLYGRTLEVLNRLCQGEEPHEALFVHVAEFTALIRERALSVVERKFLDTISVVRMLSALGYLEQDAAVHIATSGTLAEALARIDEASNKILIERAHEAFKASHL
ncbi:MAG TPA: recombination protein O N-terminal domain-containing protein [Candidatus Paceibacterota bacterium]|nr:recombination protein O N-terminal domain-containing protein [Candidatus Paceibacterota bacterium]